MSAVDVEALFRKFTVSEVRDIERKVKTDIERKKEDLRQMVGRRYRDIIEAADSIRDMKVRAEFILSSIKDVHSGFDKLQLLQQQLITAQQRAHFANYAPVDASFASETQLKLFQDIPELIWESLDDGSRPDVLSASWFLLLGENVFQGLSLSLSPQDTGPRRILQACGNQLKRQRATILARCESLLSSIKWSGKSEGAYDMEMSDCFCALVLLGSLSFSELLDRFLVSQKEKLEKVFDDSEWSSREQICTCIGILQLTLLDVHNNFSILQGDTSHLKEKMDRISSGRWRPDTFVEHLSRQSRIFNASLPSDIKNFHPLISSSVSATDVEERALQEAVGLWMQQCLDISRENLSNSLVYFERIETLTALKKSILETLGLQRPGADAWSVACRRCVSWDLSLWDALVKEKLDKRLQDLVTLRVDAHFSTMRKDVSCGEVNGDDLTEDLSEYMWTELGTDTPKMSDQSAVSTLTLKARGLFPDVYAICRKLDDSLRELQLNVECHLDAWESERGSGERRRRRICSMSGDFPEIWKCLADSCMTSITQFTRNVEQELQSLNFEEPGSRQKIIKKLVLNAQICGCLCELCPSLKTCLAYQNHSDFKSGEEAKRRSQETELWRAAKAALTSTATRAYGMWSKVAVDEAEGGLRKGGGSVSLTQWLEDAQEWESVSIEEESETGEKITSKLQVPIQASRRIHHFLSSLALSLNSLGAHRMAKGALAVFVQTSELSAVSWLEGVVSRSGCGVSQKQAVQLLFDLKAVSGLLVSKSANPEEQAILNRKVAELTEKLHQFIDPFDLDVLSPHIKRNAVKFQHKILSLYGVIVLSETAGNLSRTPATKSVAGSEQPQLLELGTGINRFQLLPVAPPSKTDFLVSIHAPVKPMVHLHAAMSTANVGEMERKRKGKEDISKSSSTAALSSFYDKISTGWFGM